MSQHDGTIANDTFPNVRTDINAAIQALFSQSSGASAPSTTFPYQIYADTTNGLTRRRNAANSAWKLAGTLAETMVQSKSTNYTVIASDFQTVINCTAALTLSLTAVATLGDGFWFMVRNSSTGTLTLDPNSSEQINGATTLALYPGASAIVFCSGSAWFTIGGLVGASDQGTWTPQISFDTPGDLSVAYSTQVGHWTRVGRLVTATCDLVTSSFTHSTASGNMLITGLGAAGFTTANNAGQTHSGSGAFQGVTKSGYTDLDPRMAHNSSDIVIGASGSGQLVSNVTAADTPSGGTVITRFTITFMI